MESSSNFTSSEQHYKYVYVCLICDEYEKAAIKQGVKKMNRAASMVQGLPMMRAVDMSLDSIESILIDRLKNVALGTMTPMDPAMKMSQSDHESNSTGNATDSAAASASASHEGESTGTGAPCDTEGVEAEACDTTQSEQAANPEKGIEGTSWSLPNFGDSTDPNSVFWRCGKWADEDWGGFSEDHWSKGFDIEEDIFGKEPGKGIGWDSETDWLDKDLIDGMTGKEFLESCFGCTWDHSLNVNLPPIDILGALEKFLKELEDILDWIINKINPTNIAAQICQLFDMFKWFCPPTWLLILGALKALLTKYMMNSLKIKLDWTAIIGLIIKTLIEWLATLLEQLKRLITMPFDCIKNIMAMISQVYRAGMEVADSATTMWGQYGAGPYGGSFWDADAATSIFSGEAWENSNWVEFSGPVDGEGAGLIPGGNSIEGFNWNDGSKKDYIADGDPNWPGPPQFRPGQKKPLGGPTSAPRGIELNGETLAPRMNKELAGIAHKYNPMESLIVILNDFKKWIEDLFNRVIQTLKSLQALFNGSLKLQIQNMGFIVMILDFISLILGLIAFDFSWDCEDGQLVPQMDRIKELCEESGLTLSEDDEQALSTHFGALTSAGPDGKVGVKSKSGLFEGELDLFECRAYMGSLDSNTEERWKAMQESFDFNQYGYQGPTPERGDV